MRLYVDLTCAFEDIGRIAHGTLRVERGLAGAFATMQRTDISFVRYDRARSRFLPVSRDDALAMVTAPTVPEPRRDLRPAWRAHPLLEIGQWLEKWVRRRVRDPIRRLRAGIGAPQPFVAAPGSIATPTDASDAGSVVTFERNSILLLTSEPRQRQSDLVAARRAGVRLAFVFYDLLNVLPPGDPRVNDPTETNLPFTDFMIREADYILSISHFSAGMLAAHIAGHGIAAAPVTVIRLSGGLGYNTPRVAVAGCDLRGFVVSVGDITPRKNQGLLIDVWRTLAERNPEGLLPLVLVGRIEKDSAPMIRRVQEDRRLSQYVRVIPNLADGEVAWLYENCRFSLFPSFNEGFGLPVAESLGFGRVCIASTAAAIPEAGQGVSVGIDPHDISAWQTGIARLLADDAELGRLEQRIASDFRRVTWMDSAQDVLAAIRWPQDPPGVQG